MSEDRLAQGRAYVKRLRAGGRTDEQIREKLRASGWSEPDVEALMGAPAGPASASAAGPARRPQAERRTDWALQDRVPPGYKPAGTAEALRGRLPAKPVQKKRPGELTFLIVLVDVVSILGVLGAGMLVLGGVAATARGAGREMMPAGLGAVILGMGVVVGLIYLGVLVVGHFLWNGHNWARITMMVLMGLAILQSLPINPLQSNRAGAAGIIPWLVIVIAALFIVVLNKGNVKAYCSN